MRLVGRFRCNGVVRGALGVGSILGFGAIMCSLYSDTNVFAAAIGFLAPKCDDRIVVSEGNSARGCSRRS